MKVQVEAVSPIQKKVIVEVPEADVDRVLDAEYKRIGKTARVKGFRPGKVPRGLLRKMFRQQATAGAAETLIRDFLPKAFEESGVDPLAVPDVERDTITEGEAFSFTLVCQVRPEIEVQGLDDLSVERKSTDPEEDEINAELERMRLEQAELEPVEERASDTGDVVTIDFTGRVKGEDEPFEGGTGKDHDVELGSGSLVPGFEDQLTGHKEGDSFEVEVEMPEDYPEALAGKTAVFDVTVKAVRNKVVPDLDDELAKDLGYEDLAAMRGEVFDKLKQQKADEEDERVRTAIVDHLIASNPVEVPQALIDESADRLRQRMAMHLRMQGLPDEILQMAMGQQDQMLQDRAAEMARRDLLLEAVADAREIEITDEQIDQRLEEIAESMGQNKVKIRAMLHQSGGLGVLTREMKRDKALEWLTDKATGVLEATSRDLSGDEGGALDNESSEGQDTPVTADAGEAKAPESEESAS